MQASSIAYRAAGSAPQRADHDGKRSMAPSPGGSPSLMARAGFRAVHDGARAVGDGGCALVRDRRAQALARPAQAARAGHVARSAAKTAVAASRPVSQAVPIPARIPGPRVRGVDACRTIDSKQPAIAAPSAGASIGALLRAMSDGMPEDELAKGAEALVRAESRDAGDAFFADLGAALVQHVGVRLALRSEGRELIVGALWALEGQDAQVGRLIHGACAAAVRSWHEDELGESFAPTRTDLLLDRIEALLTALGKKHCAASRLQQLLASLEDVTASVPEGLPGFPPELHERLGARIGRLLGGAGMPVRLRQQVLAHVLSPRRALDETRRSHELFGVLVACEAWDWSEAEHQALMKAIATAGLPADAVGALAWSLGLNCLCESPEEAGWLKHGDHLVLDAQADAQAVFTAVLRRAAHLEDTRVVERLVEGLHTVAEMLGSGAPETDSPVRALRAAMRACAPASAAPGRLEALAQALVRADARGEAAGEVARFCALEWDD